MNILFLTPRDSRKNLGGVERHVKLLTEELERRGHGVKEISLEKGDRDREGKWTAWKLLWENRRFIRQADIIHIHDIFWWYLPFRFLFPRKPVFTTFHGWEGRCPPTRSAVWQKKLAAWFCNGTIGVGSFFEKWYGVKTDRTVWGVLDKSLKINKGPAFGYKGRALDTGDKIVFFGRLEEVNGIEVVIKAMKSIRGHKVRPRSTSGSDLSIVFVGDGSYRKPAESVGKVTGMVGEPWRYLVDAEVVIASSYLAILEAAAMGKRIIAVANNPLKRDYLESHPLRDNIKIVETVEELVGEITDKSYKNYKNNKEGGKGEREKNERDQKDRREKGNTWAMGQTAEKLADEYEELWRMETPRLGGESPLRVSVVITVKDDPEGEKKLMEALVGQTLRPDEVIIVESGEHGGRFKESPCHTARRHLKPLRSHPIFARRILSAGCSRGKGRNIGVRKVRNEFIAVTDVGCRPHPDWLYKLYKCYKNYKKDNDNFFKDSPSHSRRRILSIAIAGEYRVAAKTDLQKVMGHFLVPEEFYEETPRLGGESPLPSGRILSTGFLPASRSIAFTKTAWELVGGYPEEATSGGEDLEFARRLVAHPDVKMIYCLEAVVDWEPPATWREFFRDIVKHTRGNVEVEYWPHLWRNLTVVLRWIAIGIWPWLGVGYLVWILGKFGKLEKLGKFGRVKMAMWSPVVQVVADAGVIWGLGRGIVYKFIRWLK